MWSHEGQNGKMSIYPNDVAILIEMHYRKCQQVLDKKEKEKFKFARISQTHLVDVIEM